MIHATAIVDSTARIDSSVEIGPYCVIGAGVEIAAETTVGAHTVITGPTRIGRGNKIYAQAAIGGDPQDKKYAGEPTRLEIGDNNTFREFCTINRGTSQDRGVTTIGNDNLIMSYVHVAHDVVLGNDIVLANNATLAGHVHVGDHAILGGFSKAHQFCRIGAHAFCAMDSGLSKDLPPYVIAAGHLAVPKGVNSEGLKRRGFDAAQIKAIRSAYKTLYRSDLKLAEATEHIREQAQNHPELNILVEFLTSSERSIIR